MNPLTNIIVRAIQFVLVLSIAVAVIYYFSDNELETQENVEFMYYPN